MFRAWTTCRRWRPPSSVAARQMSSTSSSRASKRSSAPPGPKAWRSASGNGKSSRWRGDSCASARCSSCSTSRRRRLTPRLSTPYLSVTRARHEAIASPARARPRTNGNITILVSHRFSTVRMADFIVVLDGARRRVGHARRTTGQGRPIRGAILNSGRCLSLSIATDPIANRLAPVANTNYNCRGPVRSIENGLKSKSRRGLN